MGYDYESEIKTKKLNKINQLINQATADETQGKFGTLDQSGKTYGPFTPQDKKGNNQGSGVAPGTGASGPPGRNYKAYGGLATMFTRRR